MSDSKRILITIDPSVFDKIAVLKTCYAFQDRFHASLATDPELSLVATLIPINESIDLKDIEKHFHDELIDQQIRLENERLFSRVRELIVEQAFRPISHRDLWATFKK